MTKRHHAGRAHYRGDVTTDIVGRVVGPPTFGTVGLVGRSATYDAATDTTTAEFATLHHKDTYTRDALGPRIKEWHEPGQSTG